MQAMMAPCASGRQGSCVAAGPTSWQALRRTAWRQLSCCDKLTRMQRMVSKSKGPGSMFCQDRLPQLLQGQLQKLQVLCASPKHQMGRANNPTQLLPNCSQGHNVFILSVLLVVPQSQARC